MLSTVSALGPDRSDPHQRREWLLLHLTENAAAWRSISGEVDAASFVLLGVLDAVARTLAELQRKALEPHGINYAEFTVLGMLRTTRPDMRRSPTELRQLVGQSSAGMTRILRKLESERLVRRVAGQGDGRRRDVVLTKKGAALVEDAFPSLFAAPSERLRRRPKRERDSWMHALDEILEFLAPGETP
jgi:DNA-binding MarR family transcriptional regulator